MIPNVRPPAGIVIFAICLPAIVLGGPAMLQANPSLADAVTGVQPKVVKIYGAGGIQGLEAYQSGFLISADGHILTTWSYVLDTADDSVGVTLSDGRRFEARVVGNDPRLEIAVLKIDARDLPYFALDQAVEIAAGARVLAFSNLFGVATGNEWVSVQRGVVMARTQLSARRGAFKTTYDGPVYVLDAMTNNPGATGGVLTDRRGRLVAILGKELTNAQTNTWLNYAVPITELNSAVVDILAGKTRPRAASRDNVKKPKEPIQLQMFGLHLVPDILAKTPPFIDDVDPESPAYLAGLRPDDLVLFVNDRVVGSCKALLEELTFVDRLDAVRITVQRGQELMEVTLEARP
ncbi:MAG: serine protease [Planctomycetes bacterium]|nr:serine protease [Planctomycetota bacterium]